MIMQEPYAESQLENSGLMAQPQVWNTEWCVSLTVQKSLGSLLLHVKFPVVDNNLGRLWNWP